MDVIAVIDLGEVHSGRDVADDPPARRRVPWAAPVLVLAAVVSTVTAAGPLPDPVPAATVDVPGDARVLVDGDRLIVVQPFALSQGRGDGRYIAAFHLMDLTQLWRVELPVSGDVSGLTTGDGVLAVTGLPLPVTPGARVVDPVPHTIGLDLATGALRWRHRGVVEAQTPDGHLILSTQLGRPGAVPQASGADGGPTTVRAVTATGQILWSYTPPAGALRSYQYVDDWVRLLVVVRSDGRVELRDTTAGRPIASRLVGPLPPDTQAGRYVEVVGDLLLVRVGAEVLAYDLDGLDLRWRRPFHIGRDGWFTACGKVLCITRDGGGLMALDPNTGEVRWSDRRWTWALAYQGRLLATDQDARGGDQRIAVVDPDSGTVERDLGRWNAVDVAEESTVTFRFDGTRLLAARIDPARGARVVAAPNQVVAASCRTRPPWLWCRRTDNTLGIWRVPG